jgi:hypothetical protein
MDEGHDIGDSAERVHFAEKKRTSPRGVDGWACCEDTKQASEEENAGGRRSVVVRMTDNYE